MKRLSELSEIERDDLFYYLRNSMSYHSNAIEGITLNEAETCALLDNGFTANKKSIFDHLVVLGFADAFDLVISEANNKDSRLDILFIKRLHSLLFYKALRACHNLIHFEVGDWRKHEAYITNSDAVLARASMIDPLMRSLIFESGDCVFTLEQIAEFHINFETIHPFGDGNGRIGRLLVLYQAIKNDYLPPNIEIKDQFKYYDSLKSTKQLNDLLKSSMVDMQTLLENPCNIIGSY